MSGQLTWGAGKGQKETHRVSGAAEGGERRTWLSGAANGLVALPLQGGAGRRGKEHRLCLQAAGGSRGLHGHLVFAGERQILKNDVIVLRAREREDAARSLLGDTRPAGAETLERQGQRPLHAARAMWLLHTAEKPPVPVGTKAHRRLHLGHGRHPWTWAGPRRLPSRPDATASTSVRGWNRTERGTRASLGLGSGLLCPSAPSCPVAGCCSGLGPSCCARRPQSRTAH